MSDETVVSILAGLAQVLVLAGLAALIMVLIPVVSTAAPGFWVVFTLIVIVRLFIAAVT